MNLKNIFIVMSFSILSSMTPLALSVPPPGVGPPPPNSNQCKNGWTLTALATGPALDFGAFSVDAGTGTLVINNAGTLSPGGQVTVSSTAPTSTFKVEINNTLDPVTCANLGFTIDWAPAAGSLTGAGTAMPLSVLMTDSASQFTNTTLPVTMTPASVPITLTFHGTLNVGFPQAAGVYSLAHTVDLTQSGTTTSIGSTVTATSLTPVSIIETMSMNFGTIASGTTASTITLDTLGGRSVIGDAQTITTGAGTAASFRISGEANLTYAVSISASAVLENAGGQQITASAFTNNSSGTIPATAVDTFQVGAKLTLGPLQTAGTYSTTTGGGSPYTVTVNYN